MSCIISYHVSLKCRFFIDPTTTTTTTTTATATATATAAAAAAATAATTATTSVTNKMFGGQNNNVY